MLIYSERIRLWERSEASNTLIIDNNNRPRALNAELGAPPMSSLRVVSEEYV